jgi:hypothetical protein
MTDSNLSDKVKQTVTSGNTSDPQPFADFNSWFEAVIEEVNPALVVGVARGAVRLLQLQNAHLLLGDIPVVSDHALPFLPDFVLEKKRVLIFDDSVIFGSTMSKIKDYLTRRGAIVFCASYVVDRCSFYGESRKEPEEEGTPSYYCDIPIRRKHLLWPSEIRIHHDTLIGSLLKTPSHYNLDFPTFRIEIPKYSAADIPYVANILCKGNIFRELFDVSTPASNGYGIYRYSALFKPIMWDLFPKDGLYCRAYSKARITFVPGLNEILLTPIPQLIIAGHVRYEDVKFSDDNLALLWKNLDPPIHIDDPFYHQAVFRLLTSFVALIMGDTMTREIVSRLQSECPVRKIDLLRDDVKLVLGEENTRALENIWSHLLPHYAFKNLFKQTLEKMEDAEEPVDSNLLKAVAVAWQRYPSLKPGRGEIIYEILGKVFLTLRLATDSPECRARNPDASRLEIGLSYEGIRRLLRDECGIEFTPDDITLAMDMCVDNGQSVPKILAAKSKWLRLFYCGEGEDSQPPMQLKNAIYKGYSDFLKQGKRKPLSPFDMHKLCVTLKDLFPWLPISSKYYTFGKYASIGKSETELIHWLTDPTSGPLKIGLKDKKKVLLLNENFQPCVNTTWRRERSRDFFDGFAYIAEAFSRLKDEPKLLLSTCRTHRHAYNAIAFEAHGWAGFEQSNFEKFLKGIQFSSGEAPDITWEAIASLYWCTRYICEAWKKYSVFARQFDTLSRRAMREFKRQGQSAERFWDYFIVRANMLNPSIDEEIDRRLQFLMPLVHQMSRLTAFMAKALIDLNVLPLAKLSQQFEEGGTSLEREEFRWLYEQEFQTVANEYDRAIKDHELPGWSIVKTELPCDAPYEGGESPDRWLEKTVATVQQCFLEIKAALERFCPRYDISDGEFPFSPDSTRRILSDGSIERSFSDIYVLTMDIIGSTDSVQTSEFKQIVVDTFNHFKQPKLYFEDTGNDAYVACCEDPTVLWDIANAISVSGEMAKRAGGHFGGTRKGLSFGSVRIVERPDGYVIIKDDLTPHLLPRAFSMLGGIDAYCDEKSVNKDLVMIIQEHCAKQCAPILKLDLRSSEKINIKTKHYRGSCYVLDLKP